MMPAQGLTSPSRPKEHLYNPDVPMAAPADRAGCPLHLLPDPWKAGFLAECTDGKTRLALAQTCKGCWQWLVRDTAEFRCTVSADSDPFYSVQAAKQAVQLRTEASSTSLVLQQTEEDHRVLRTTLAALSSNRVSTLCFDVPNVTRPLLRAAASAFPKLHTLQLGSDSRDPPCRAAVPHPEDMPSLQHLVVGPVADTRVTAVQQGIRRLLPQLTSLKLTGEGGTWSFAGTVEEVLTTPSTSLRHLNVPLELRCHLLQLITRNAPALQHLGVSGLQHELSQAPAAPYGQCTWEVLELSGSPHADEPSVDLGELSNLPPTATLEVRYTHPGRLSITNLQNVAQQVAEQLQRFTFTNLATVRFLQPLQPSNPAALTATLQVVAPLRVPDRTLHLTLTAPISDAHEAALLTIAEQWPKLSITGPISVAHTSLSTPLPPLQTWQFIGQEFLGLAWLTTLSGNLSSVKQLCLKGVEASSIALKANPSPWRQLQVDKLDFATLGNMPLVAVDGGRVEVRVTQVLEVYLSAQQAGRDVKPQYQLPGLHLLDGCAVNIHAPTDTQDPVVVAAALRYALLQLAQAQGRGGPIMLHDFKLSASVVRELPHLPSWGDRLEFITCSWQDDAPAVYHSLGQLIPNNFKVWYLAGAQEAVMRAVCAGAPINRTKVNPLTLVHYARYAVSKELQATLDAAGVYQHVKVLTRDEYEDPYWEAQEPVVDSDGE